jgi:hypothetical protein
VFRRGAVGIDLREIGERLAHLIAGLSDFLKFLENNLELGNFKDFQANSFVPWN